MKANDYLKAKGRLCKQYLCGRCPLRACDTIGPTGYQAEYSCIKLERDIPKQAIEIVEKWAKDHPVKTYLSVFLEKFPKAKVGKEGFPSICVSGLFNTEKYCNDRSINCKECWNREYKEELNEI